LESNIQSESTLFNPQLNEKYSETGPEPIWTRREAQEAAHVRLWIIRETGVVSSPRRRSNDFEFYSDWMLDSSPNPLLATFADTLKLYKELLLTNVGFEEPYKSVVFNSSVIVQTKSQISKCMWHGLDSLSVLTA
jgi:hypothetical protein